MKLLYILAETNDFWSSRLPLALAVKEKGCEVHLAAPGAARDSKLKEFGFHGHDLPPARNGFSTSAAVKNIFAIKKLLRNLKPDIAHTFTLKYSLLAGLAACRAKNTRHVFTIAGLGYLFSDSGIKSKILLCIAAPFLKHALHKAETVTFQNTDDMQILIRKNFLRAENSVLIRGSGVDLQKFSPRNNTESDPPLVLMPTRLVHDKGISIFIAMAEILRKRRIFARFQIAGGVTEHNPLAITKVEMERMVAGTNVEWIGRVDDMPALYARATLVVYPSWYREGIPRVLLEAAASGKAVVTTDHPGCREAVIYNETGLLVPVKNAEATADAVESILKNYDLRKKMESAGRTLAEREFGIDKVVAETLKIYRL
ncbi:MAG: glycosyltransferase family 1 protein [Alphaproteobacteria bacterium PRO2]|nr:glycosyltransferase family 1 protein [Alphaproteobacteria bacterium PRO2]